MDLGDVLRHLYYIAAKPFALDDGIMDVLLHIFRTPPGGRTIDRERQWSLSCELQKIGVGTGLSNPFLILAMPHINISQKCNILGPDLRGCHLNFELGAHLRPQRWPVEGIVQNGEAVNQARHHTIQDAVDGFLKATARLISGRSFTNPIDLISSVKPGLLSYLKASPLKTVVDFHNLEICLIRRLDRRRYVSSMLLNADGSERLDSAPTELEFPVPRSEANSYAPTRLPNHLMDTSIETSPPSLHDSSVHHRGTIPLQIEQGTRTYHRYL